MKDAQARFEARCAAIHLLRGGSSVAQVATQLGHSRTWVYTCKDRFNGDFEALRERSRAPRHHPKALSETEKQSIRKARSELEAEATSGLGYIGAPAVRARLKAQGIVVSRASIERELKAAGMTRRWQRRPQKVDYPHLKPEAPHLLCQVDIVPHYLPGGQLVANFNAIDTLSRYASGYSYTSKKSREAFDFLCRLWREQGIARYTQLDNEGCFSGGSTHPYVLGKVLRLGLFVGTEVIYSPPYHPQSNGYVERFHQDYSKHVWKSLTLRSLDQVNEGAQRFFRAYRESGHKRRLDTMTPAELHRNPRLLTEMIAYKKLPLTQGRVHFIRQVGDGHAALKSGYIQVLNVPWLVGQQYAGQGVWATLSLQAPDQAWLRVYDAAPDRAARKRLAMHRFPLSETVHPSAFDRRRTGSTFQRTMPWMQETLSLIRGLIRYAALW